MTSTQNDWIHGGETQCAIGDPLTSGQIIAGLLTITIIYSMLTALITLYPRSKQQSTQQNIASLVMILLHSFAAYILASHAHKCRATEGILKALVITVIGVLIYNYFQDKPIPSRNIMRDEYHGAAANTANGVF